MPISAFSNTYLKSYCQVAFCLVTFYTRENLISWYRHHINAKLRLIIYLFNIFLLLLCEIVRDFTFQFYVSFFALKKSQTEKTKLIILGSAEYISLSSFDFFT